MAFIRLTKVYHMNDVLVRGSFLKLENLEVQQGIWRSMYRESNVLG
jgi:hypothetical protein